mgnify:CR=1 FL=1
MIIAIEKGLEKIKIELENRGYETFYIGEGKIADAIVYISENLPYFQVNDSSIKSLYSPNMGNFNGALLINVRNKSIDEIVNIINTRIYSPLF